MKKLLTGSRRRTALLPLLMALLAAGWLAEVARPAEAAGTYTVTSTLDDGSDGTLRSAVALANADPGAVVVFAPGVAGVIALQSELDLSASMTILGPGTGVVQIDGGDACRLFSVTAPDAQVTLSGLALQNGTAFNDPNTITSGVGGAVYNGGTLTLTGCVLTSNGAFYGGAVYSGGALTLSGCTFTGNGAGEGAGGAVYSGGTLSANGCTFTGNAAFYAGGLYSDGSTLLATCTVSSNTAIGNEDGNSGSGAGVYNNGQLTLYACVITGNTAYGGSPDNGGPGGAGGGLYNAGTLLLTGCTVSGNSALPDLGGTSSGPDATGLGGGAANVGTLFVNDDIFYADFAASSAEVANDILDSPGATVNAAACDIQGSGSDGTGGFGQNILDVDPLFVRPVHAGGAGDPGDLHLQDDSPCILAGTFDPANATDFDGNPRPNPPSIGAYDYQTTAPVAYGQSVTTAAGQPLVVTLTGADPDSLPLSFGALLFPTGGTLSGYFPNIIYTPNPGFSGTDSFTFVASDGFQDSPPATVRITVSPMPVLSALTFPASVTGGTVVTATVTLSAVTPTNVVVGLSSSDSSVVRVFRAVFIPAGSSSVTFPINTYRSHTTESVTIRATLDSVAVTQGLTITGR